MAQLGERCLRKAEAGGSSPLISTKGCDVEATCRAGRLDCFTHTEARPPGRATTEGELPDGRR